MKIFNHERVPSVLHEPNEPMGPDSLSGAATVRDGSRGSWLILEIFLCGGGFRKVHTEEE